MYEDIEEIRRKKLEELKKKLIEEKMEEEARLEETRKQIEQMEAVVKRYLDHDARERLNYLKIGHPDRYLQVLTILYQNIAMGRLNRVLSDKEFKKILERLLELTKRKTKIRFIRK